MNFQNTQRAYISQLKKKTISPKKIHRWPVGTGKDAHYQLLVEKHKSKLQ